MTTIPPLPTQSRRPNPEGLRLKPAARAKLSETVARQLIDSIQGLAPGTAVPPERELTRLLGVSRTTVREALRGLSVLGYVDIRHGQGVFVARAAPNRLASDDLSRALAKGVTHDLVEARRIIVVEIARLAAERRTEEDLAKMREVLDAHSRAVATGHTPGRYGSAFDIALVDATHNEVLAGVMRSLIRPTLQRVSHLYVEVPEFGALEVDMHQRVLDAVAAGDPELAAKRMAEHVAEVDDFYRQAGEA